MSKSYNLQDNFKCDLFKLYSINYYAYNRKYSHNVVYTLAITFTVTLRTNS